MKKALEILLMIIIVSGISLSMPVTVQAFPPLPSSFYGTIKLNGENLPDGTRVEAQINNHIVAYTLTFTYNGVTVYSLDVPGDDLSTAGIIEGGKEEEPIEFIVGGISVDQTGIWHSGTNVNLDLTANSTNTPLPPQPSPMPLPTQTQIQIQSTKKLNPQTQPTHIQSTSTVIYTVKSSVIARSENQETSAISLETTIIQKLEQDSSSEKQETSIISLEATDIEKLEQGTTPAIEGNSTQSPLFEDTASDGDSVTPYIEHEEINSEYSEVEKRQNSFSFSWLGFSLIIVTLFGLIYLFILKRK